MSDGSQLVLEAKNISKRFQEGALDVSVLNNIHLTINKGQTTAIVGTSGSGKSTLLHLLGGLDKPTQGEICLLGQNLFKLSAKEQGRMRNRHMGFIYQFHHLLAEFSAIDNVAMPLFIRRYAPENARKEAGAMLKKVGLTHRMHHRPSELSGGERQRVAIARALVTKPNCLLADEPTGNLDRQTGLEIFYLMLELTQTHEAALVMVSHDLDLASRCDHRYLLNGGVLTLN